MDSKLISADPCRDIRKIVRRRGFRIDPNWPGETESLKENPNVRRQYYRRNGASLEELGESFLEEGVTDSRPSMQDVLELLEMYLRTEYTFEVIRTDAGIVRRKIGGKITFTASEIQYLSAAEVTAAESELARVKRNRSHPYDCPACHDIAYHSGFHWKGRCECGEVYVCRDPEPSKILERIETAANVPF